MPRNPSRIIVLGMVRSGTSLATKLVQQWGAYAGLEPDLFGDRYGYLEHLGLQKLNDELMDHNDRIPPPSSLLLERSQNPTFYENALQLLDLMDKQTIEHRAVAWVWKDPRLPMLLPFWERLWGDVIYVITIRHPVETIRSGASMEGIAEEDLPLSAGLLYWQYNMLNILSFTRNSQRKIFMDFDQLTDNPLRECTRLGQFLNEQCGRQPDEGQQSLEVLVSQVMASEHHYHEPGSLAELEYVTREQRALYDFMRVKTIHPHETFKEEDFALYPGWREYLQAMDMLVSLAGTPES
jgi:hypothetical protein